jgi:hypothetical protein
VEHWSLRCGLSFPVIGASSHSPFYMASSPVRRLSFDDSCVTEHLFACPGGVIGCFPACVAQVSPPERIGSRLGFVLTAMSISTLTGPPIAGGTPLHGIPWIATHFSKALLDRGIASNKYFSNASFSGAVMLVGAFFALLAKLSTDRRLLKVV